MEEINKETRKRTQTTKRKERRKVRNLCG